MPNRYGIEWKLVHHWIHGKGVSLFFIFLFWSGNLIINSFRLFDFSSRRCVSIQKQCESIFWRFIPWKSIDFVCIEFPYTKCWSIHTVYLCCLWFILRIFAVSHGKELNTPNGKPLQAFILSNQNNLRSKFFFKSKKMCSLVLSNVDCNTMPRVHSSCTSNTAIWLTYQFTWHWPISLIRMRFSIVSVKLQPFGVIYFWLHSSTFSYGNKRYSAAYA